MNGYSDSGSAINSKSYTSMNNGNGNGNSNGNGHGHATERHRQNSLEQDMLDDLAQHERGDSVNSLGDDNEGMHKGGGVTSSQARRDQNRIAQREFRARKQQHIKDLEARIQILSGDKDERHELMSFIIKHLLNENAQLRKMVKNLAGFIGEGLATTLPRIGMTIETLNEFVNRPESETAHEAFAALKVAKERESQSGNTQSRSASIFDPLPSSRRTSMGPSSAGAGGPGAAGTGGSGSSASKRKRSGPNDGPIDRNEDDVEPQSGHKVSKGAKGKSNSGNSGGGGASNNANTILQNFQDDNASSSGSTPHQSPRNLFQGFLPDRSMNFLPEFQITPNTGNMPNGVQYVQSPSTFHRSLQQSLQSQQQPVQNQQSMLPRPPQPPVTGMDPQAQAYFEAMSGSGVNFMHDTTGTTDFYDRQAQTSSSSQPRPQQGPVPPPLPSAPENNLHQLPPSIAQEVAARPEFATLIDKCISNAVGRQQEAMQLISYHMENYRNNPNYRLPPSLRPTPIQQQFPHEFLIDGVIFPSLRSKMILLRGKYDLLRAFESFTTGWTVQGEDTLDHNSWEVSEECLRDNIMLLDNEVLMISNKWRMARGESPLTRESLLISK